MEALTDANKVVGLEVNTEKTKCMMMSHHKDAGQNHNTKIANRFSENVAQFKYFGVTVADQYLIQEEVKRKLNWAMFATIQSRTFLILVCCLKT
jgi:hypothetical protein